MITASLDVQKKIIKRLAKDYDVKLRFKSLKDCSGAFYPPNKIILDPDADGRNILETFFHELGHLHAYRTNKFKVYHSKFRFSSNYAALNALRAERWVDKWGQEECARVLPEIPWRGSYRTQADVVFLNKYVREGMVYYN